MHICNMYVKLGSYAQFAPGCIFGHVNGVLRILFSMYPLDITRKAQHNRLMVYRHRFSVVPSNHVMGVERGTEV